MHLDDFQDLGLFNEQIIFLFIVQSDSQNDFVSNVLFDTK